MSAQGQRGAGLEVELGGGRKATIMFKAGIGGHIKLGGGGKPAVEADLAETVRPGPEIRK